MGVWLGPGCLFISFNIADVALGRKKKYSSDLYVNRMCLYQFIIYSWLYCLGLC